MGVKYKVLDSSVLSEIWEYIEGHEDTTGPQLADRFSLKPSSARALLAEYHSCSSRAVFHVKKVWPANRKV